MAEQALKGIEEEMREVERMLDQLSTAGTDAAEALRAAAKGSRYETEEFRKFYADVYRRTGMSHGDLAPGALNTVRESPFDDTGLMAHEIVKKRFDQMQAGEYDGLERPAPLEEAERPIGLAEEPAAPHIPAEYSSGDRGADVPFESKEFLDYAQTNPFPGDDKASPEEAQKRQREHNRNLREQYAKQKGFDLTPESEVVLTPESEVVRARPIAHPVGTLPPDPPRRPQAQPIEPTRAQDVVLDAEKGPPVARMVERGPMGEMVDMLPKELQAVLGSFGGSGGTLGKLGNLAGAGGAAGLAGAAEVAGGPLALIMLAIDGATKGVKAFEAGVELAGKEAQLLAGNDGMGMLKTATDATASALEEFGPVGKLWGAEVRAAASVVTTFSDTMAAFVHRGKELSQYSAPLAAANAVAEVRQIGADIRESTRGGANLARLTEAQSRASVAFQDAIVPIKDLITGKLATLMGRVATIMERAAPFIEREVEVNEKVNGVLSEVVELLVNAIPGGRAIIARMDLAGRAERDRHDLELALIARVDSRELCHRPPGWADCATADAARRWADDAADLWDIGWLEPSAGGQSMIDSRADSRTSKWREEAFRRLSAIQAATGGRISVESAEREVLDLFKRDTRALMSAVGEHVQMGRSLQDQSRPPGSTPPEATGEEAAIVASDLARIAHSVASVTERTRHDLVATTRFGELIGFDLTEFVREMWGLTGLTPDATERPEDAAYAGRMVQVFRELAATLIIFSLAALHTPLPFYQLPSAANDSNSSQASAVSSALRWQ